MFNSYVKFSLWFAISLMAFPFLSLAQVTRQSTSSSSSVSQSGIVIGENLQLVEGKSFDLEYKKDVHFKTTIKVLEYDPYKNLPRYFASVFVGISSFNTPTSTESGGIMFTGKFKYFTNNPVLRYDFMGGYGFGNTPQTNCNRLTANLGIHYVPIRFKTAPIKLFGKVLSFSRGAAIDPVTNLPYQVFVHGKYQIVREIGFRAGALYNGFNFNLTPTADSRFASNVTNLGGYAGITYGTVRNLIIGSTNLGMHRNSKYNDIIFDLMYAPTNFTTDYTGRDKPTNFSDLGYRMIVNFIKPVYHRKVSFQAALELGRYPGINTNYFGFHLGLAFSDRKKYDADEVANDLKASIVAKDSLNSDVDSIMNGTKQTYDFITKNKKGYYIVKDKKDDLLRKPMKMVTTSRQLVITTTNTTTTTNSRGAVVSRTTNSSSQRVKVDFYFGALGGSEYAVEFSDFSSPKQYQKSVLYQYLKEVPSADKFYMETIKKNRRTRRIFTWGAIASFGVALVAYSQGGDNNMVGHIAAGTGIACGLGGLIAAPFMKKKDFDKALSIYNKGLSGKAPRSK